MADSCLKNQSVVEELDWREYDLSEWNSLDERFLADEDRETLQARRKEIDAKKKQDFLDRVSTTLTFSLALVGSSMRVPKSMIDPYGFSVWSLRHR